METLEMLELMRDYMNLDTESHVVISNLLRSLKQRINCLEARLDSIEDFIGNKKEES